MTGLIYVFWQSSPGAVFLNFNNNGPDACLGLTTGNIKRAQCLIGRIKHLSYRIFYACPVTQSKVEDCIVVCAERNLGGGIQDLRHSKSLGRFDRDREVREQTHALHRGECDMPHDRFYDAIRWKLRLMTRLKHGLGSGMENDENETVVTSRLINLSRIREKRGVQTERALWARKLR